MVGSVVSVGWDGQMVSMVGLGAETRVEADKQDK